MAIPLKGPEGDLIAFEVRARPISLQGHPASKRDLKRKVARQIEGAQFLLSGEVHVSITFHVHERERYETLQSPDVDNILKPLLDALCGPRGVLVNDCQVQSVECRWIDWTRTDHSLLFEIRHKPDEWIPKEGLFWVDMGNKLCMPLFTSMPKHLRAATLASWKQAFAERERLLRQNLDYYKAQCIMPIQRPFLRPQLRGFRVVPLRTLSAECKM